MRKRSIAIAAGLALALLMGVPTRHGYAAPAVPLQQEDPKAEAFAEVVVLHGTNDGKGISEDIKDLEEHLKQPPFSTYDTWTKLDTKKLPLLRDVAGDMKLPDESTLKLTLKNKKEERYVVMASITRKNGKKFLPGMEMNATPGKYMFIAGQKYDRGILVLGIRVVDK